METYQLESCRLRVTPPVVVGRARGHHWFSSLHSVGESGILCEVVTTADTAQGKWPARLYLSRDTGRSWQSACEIDCHGPSSISLEPHKILLMPYELWSLSPGDKRNAVADGTIVTCADGGVATEPASVRFLGFPRDLDDYNGDEVFLLTSGNILRLRDGRLFTTLYGRFGSNTERHQYECVAAVSENGGFTWQYLSTVASWRDTPGASEGPNESSTVRIPDGRLMCVYRIGSGRQYHYHQSYSSDDGQTWTGPRRMENQWSVLPQLACLENGALVLSGGRPGLMLWVCADGHGEHWEALNLAEHHNTTFPDPNLHFPDSGAAASSAGLHNHTTSYTGMIAVSPHEVLICYDRLANGWEGAPGPWGSHDTVFSVGIRIDHRNSEHA